MGWPQCRGNSAYFDPKQLKDLKLPTTLRLELVQSLLEANAWEDRGSIGHVDVGDVRYDSLAFLAGNEATQYLMSTPEY